MVYTVRVFLFGLLSLFFIAAAPARAEEETLCPDIDVMKKTSPGDMAGVQADIERLNLCVERAKLLKQLDDVIKAREETLKKITNPDADLTGSLTTGVNGIPPLPIGALPPLKAETPKNLKPGEVRVTQAAGNAFDQGAPQATVAPAWQIRKIWGQGAGMRAQIADKESGTILNVIKGDSLPDGGVIETISVKGVAVSRNGKITDLSWEQLTEQAPQPASNVKVVP